MKKLTFTVHPVSIVHAMEIEEKLYTYAVEKGPVLREVTFHHPVLSNATEIYRLDATSWVAIMDGKFYRVWVALYFGKDKTMPATANEPINGDGFNRLNPHANELLEAVRGWREGVWDDGGLEDAIDKFEAETKEWRKKHNI